MLVKRLFVSLLVLALLSAPAVCAHASEPAQEASGPAQEASEPAQGASEPAQEASGPTQEASEAASGATEHVLNADVINDLLSGITDEQIRQFILDDSNILESEELQRYLSYPEVQDLLVTLADDGLRFVRENQELTEKVLRTLEIEDYQVRLIMVLLDTGGDIYTELQEGLDEHDKQSLLQLIDEFQNNESCKRIVQLVEENFDSETLAELLRNIAEAMDGESAGGQ